jgi:sugar (pentulose or hexulose) kinase
LKESSRNTTTANTGTTARTGILVLDVGTTSIRGIVFDAVGSIHFSRQIETSPLFLGDGRVEQDPLVWSEAVLTILRDCSDYAKTADLPIQALSLTAFRSPVFPVSRDNTPLHNTLMWQDRRSAPLYRNVCQYDDLVFEKTGLRISPVFSALKILWFTEQRPDLVKKAHKFVGVYEYILHLLGGEFVTDHSIASRSNLFNLHTLAWDPELTEIFGIEESILCRTVPPGSVCGHLQLKTAELTGLPAGIPIIAAGGDQQCAALGLGVFAPGSIAANTGTGSYVIGISSEPVIDPERGIFCNVSAVPGYYILEATILTSGTIYRWFSEQFYDRQTPDEQIFKRVDREITSSPPGARGVIALPYFEGSGSPDWNPSASGTFCNLSLSTTRADCARAIIEGIAIEMDANIDCIEKLSGPAGSITVSGGMTRFAAFNQIQADIFEREVIRHTCPEATAAGAWMSASAALGQSLSVAEAFSKAVERGEDSFTTYTPDPALAHLYRKKKKAQKELAGRLFSS